MSKKSLALTGFMGAGKSVIARGLSEKTGMQVIDLDEYIEKKAGKTISDIFAEDGEEVFRNLEVECLKEVISGEAKIISLGGGTPLKEQNREVLKNCNVVFLKADADTVWKRVKHDTKRPLLQCDDPYKKICDLLEFRNPIYESCADITVISNQRKDKIIEEIISYYENTCN